MKLKRKMVALLALCFALTMVISVPVMAAAKVPVSNGAAITRAYTVWGKLNRTNTVLGPRVADLSNGKELKLNFPRNNNRDLVQGQVTFSNGVRTETFSFINWYNETWTYDASMLGTGQWEVTLTGYVMGASGECTVQWDND